MGLATNDSFVYSSIFDNYQSQVKPACGGPGVADEVQIGMALRQIIDLVGRNTF